MLALARWVWLSSEHQPPPGTGAVSEFPIEMGSFWYPLMGFCSYAHTSIFKQIQVVGHGSSGNVPKFSHHSTTRPSLFCFREIKYCLCSPQISARLCLRRHKPVGISTVPGACPFSKSPSTKSCALVNSLVWTQPYGFLLDLFGE